MIFLKVVFFPRIKKLHLREKDKNPRKIKDCGVFLCVVIIGIMKKHTRASGICLFLGNFDNVFVC